MTAEREATETRQLLVRELNHRVKNLFAVIGNALARLRDVNAEIWSLVERYGFPR